METVRRSIDLLRQSWRVLRADKELIAFPILSGLAGLAILISFALPIALLMPWEEFSKQNGDSLRDQLTIMHYAVMFGFYVLNFLVMNFFNAALAACVMERFRGGNPTVSFGLRAAVGKLHHILGWSILAATVGMILRAIQERSGIFGKLITGFIGIAFTVASYFVIPVLVAENVGPIESLKRSAKLMTKTWGTALVSNVGLGIIGFLVAIAIIIPMAGGVTLLVMGTVDTQTNTAMVAGGIACLVLGVVLIIAWALISSTLNIILNTALYKFATTGEAPAGFDTNSMQRAFREKAKKK
jgi:hypothetical protein